MTKDTLVIWRLKKDANGKVTTPGGSGITTSDEADGQISVEKQTESWGDGHTKTLTPPVVATFPVAELVVL